VKIYLLTVEGLHGPAVSTLHEVIWLPDLVRAGLEQRVETKDNKPIGLQVAHRLAHRSPAAVALPRFDLFMLVLP